MRGTPVGRGMLVVTAVLVAVSCAADDDGAGGEAAAPVTTAPVTTVPVTTAPVTTVAATTAPAPSTTAPAPTTAAAAARTTTTMLAAVATGADLRVDVLANSGGDAPGTPPWLHVQSTKCGGPVGDWPITVTGTKDMGSGLTFVVDGSGVASLGGTGTAASGSFVADYTLDVLGVPLSTGGQVASYAGTATFADGVLTLDGAVSGTSHGENPYRQVIMSMYPSSFVMSLPATPGTYC